MYQKKLTVLLFLSLLLITNTINAKEVKICDDISEWPPYSYYERTNGVINKTKLTGAVTQLLEEIFKIADLDYSVSMIPWKRCTTSVDNFDRVKKYEMFINGSYSQDRAEKYLISKTIYSTHHGVFYSTKKYPKGLPFYKQSDINKFKLCSVNGYDISKYYDVYGLKKGTKVDQGSPTLYSVLQKISIGRCDILINSKEPLYGAVLINKYKLPKYIKSINIPNAKPVNFHIFIAKKSPRANELLKKINEAILILQNNGVSNDIFNKYLLKNQN